MTIYRPLTRGLGLAILALSASGTASALPTLQLDFEGGSYVGGADETTYCEAASCDLYALLTPQDQKGSQTDAEYAAYVASLLADTYYISIALVPKTSAPANLGSFTVNGGTPISVTNDMIYGTPPVEALLAMTDPNDLASHGIFETYFYEVDFMFNAAKTVLPYNAQDDATVNPSDRIGGVGGYYASLSIDVTNLDPSINLHFDLYNTAVYEVKGNIDAAEQLGVDDFAPFSKDAQQAPGDPIPPSGIPEPGTLALLGVGMLGGLAFRKKRRKAKL